MDTNFRVATVVFLFLAVLPVTTDAAGTLVDIETNYGDITIELYDNLAPITVENFLNYVDNDFYDGLIFHRVIPDFMIQAGGFYSELYNADFDDPDFDPYDSAYYPEPNDPITLETVAGLQNLRGTIAMARTDDPDSATSGFFINVTDNDLLDPNESNDGYAVFGEVISGMWVVDEIAAFETQNVHPAFEDLPNEPVIIQSASRRYNPNAFITVDVDSSPMYLSMLNPASGQTERLQLIYIGSGQAELLVDQNIVDQNIRYIFSVTITDSSSRSMFSFQNIDNPDNLAVDELILNRSMHTLSCYASIDSITSIETRKAAFKNVYFGDVRVVNAPNCYFKVFRAKNLGDTNAVNQLVFDARGVYDLEIMGDIDNVIFFDTDSTNKYRDIIVTGTINNTFFNGGKMNSLTVYNNNSMDNAVDNCEVDLESYLKEFIVNTGNVIDSTFLVERSINDFELYDGNLQNTYITVSNSSGKIKNLQVHDNPNTDLVGGNITGCQIDANKSIGYIYAQGQIDPNTYITSLGTSRSKITRIRTGGDCAAVINAAKVGEVLIGFDSSGDRIDEDEQYTGSDFTGSITSWFGLKKLSVTGAIQGANINNHVNSIKSIFVEDGFDATVSAGKNIDRMTVGLINGSSRRIANKNADVSGSITAAKLKKLYYTGQLDWEALHFKHGTIKQID